MADLNIKKFLNNFARNYNPTQTFSAKGAFNIQNSQPPVNSTSTGQNLTPTNAMPAPNSVNKNSMPMQLNQLQNIDRAIYAKEVMGFPRNANEFIYMLQRGMNQAQFNQMFANQMAMQRNNLSQMQAQILAQLQGLDTSVAKEMVNVQLASQIQGSLKNLEILSGGMINLNQVAELIQKNGKDAITKLIMSMTEASKAGISDLTQMKEMAKLINASISVASENNPQKTLKLLLMLYLPWLPLEDGVGFDMEIQQKNESTDEKDSILIITVSTINYGIVKATIMLESSNSVQVAIECSKTFPKEELNLRISKEQKHYSMDSTVNIEINNNIKPQNNSKQSATINQTQTNEINPYLLLMAHAIIKHIISIDNNKTLGITSHID